MKKKTISTLTHPGFILLFFMTFLFPLLIIFLVEPAGSKVLLYFKAMGYILAVELSITLLCSMIAGITFLIFYIYNKNVEKKKINIQNKNKENLIQKFSLKENEFTEVFGIISNCTENKKVLLEIINGYNDSSNIKYFVNMLNSVIDELPISFLTEVLKRFGCKFYLSLKDNKEIFLTIKNKNNSYSLLIEPDVYSEILENWTIV